MNTVEILKGAKALLVTKGWTQGLFEFGGCLCTAGAISVAAGGRSTTYTPETLPAMAAIADQLSPDIDPDAEERIWKFNDASGRTVEEVLSVFDKAIAAEEAKAA